MITYIHIEPKIKIMANMSYCRFENTYNDLKDCLEHINDECENEHDEHYRLRMIELLAHVQYSIYSDSID